MRHTPRIRAALAPSALLLAALLAGCGPAAPSSTAAGPPTAAPPATDTAAPAPAPTPDPATDPDEAVTLPWPAADPGTVADLQRAVDSGTEPWLLDPAEVAESYVTAAHGWMEAEAQPEAGGQTVRVVQGSNRLTLSLTQPGRTGAGGIWVVTAERDGG